MQGYLVVFRELASWDARFAFHERKRRMELVVFEGGHFRCKKEILKKPSRH